MAGQILQLSVSKGGVPKYPVLGGEVGPVGIIGDVQRNRKYHGGPRQALLWITSEGLDELKAAGFPVYPGALGENVTTTGIDRRSVRLGQQWRMGEVVGTLRRRGGGWAGFIFRSSSLGRLRRGNR
jgi:MOSC domain-containing protein YiiM